MKITRGLAIALLPSLPGNGTSVSTRQYYGSNVILIPSPPKEIFPNECSIHSNGMSQRLSKHVPEKTKNESCIHVPFAYIFI